MDVVLGCFRRNRWMPVRLILGVALLLGFGCNKKNGPVVRSYNTYYGYVTDAGTAAAIPAADVEWRIFSDGTTTIIKTDTSGFYLIRVAISIPDYIFMTCRATGYQTRSTTLSYIPKDSARVDFQLPKI